MTAAEFRQFQADRREDTDSMIGLTLAIGIAFATSGLGALILAIL